MNTAVAAALQAALARATAWNVILLWYGGFMDNCEAMN